MPNGNNLKWWERLPVPWSPWPEQAAVAPPAQLSPKAFEALATLTPEERARLPYPIPEEPLASQIARRKKDEEEARRVVAELGKPKPTPPQPTEPPPAGFRWAFDRELNRWVPQFAGLTAQQRAQEELERERRTQEQARWETEMEFKQRQTELARQPTPVSPYQQQEFGLLQQQVAQAQTQFEATQAQAQAQFEAGLQFQQQQAQMAQEEQERQYMSQLAANPISWLQYASYTGEAPLVQPWMIPLGAQGAEQNLQVGQPLLQEGQAITDLPQLRTPSAQLQARWGPTAQSQYLGYRQARTGATPEETQFRLGTGRAPAGMFRGFSRFR